MEEPTKDPLYRGSPVGMFLGLLSFVALVSALWQLALLHWLNAGLGFIVSLVLGYIGYRAAGGARNPGILRSMWREKGLSEIVQTPGFDWETKVTALFEHLEDVCNGDLYQAAITLTINQPPPAVGVAHQQMVDNPTPENWAKLRETIIRNPPPGHR